MTAEMTLWHVTLTMSGSAEPERTVLAALERLADERPFILSGRYAADRAEIAYWEEARDCGDAAALALRLWGEHKASAGLPPWAVVGLEVLDESSYRARGGPGVVPVAAAGSWRQF